MLGEDHRVGGWSKELKFGELKTGLVYILLGDSRETNVCSMRWLVPVDGLLSGKVRLKIVLTGTMR